MRIDIKTAQLKAIANICKKLKGFAELIFDFNVPQIVTFQYYKSTSFIEGQLVFPLDCSPAPVTAAIDRRELQRIADTLSSEFVSVNVDDDYLSFNSFRIKKIYAADNAIPFVDKGEEVALQFSDLQKALKIASTTSDKEVAIIVDDDTLHVYGYSFSRVVRVDTPLNGNVDTLKLTIPVQTSKLLEKIPYKGICTIQKGERSICFTFPEFKILARKGEEFDNRFQTVTEAYKEYPYKASLNLKELEPIVAALPDSSIDVKIEDTLELSYSEYYREGSYTIPLIDNNGKVKTILNGAFISAIPKLFKGTEILNFHYKSSKDIVYFRNDNILYALAPMLRTR